MFFCDYQGGVLVIVAPSDSGGMLRMYANTLQSEYINPSTMSIISNVYAYGSYVCIMYM